MDPLAIFGGFCEFENAVLSNFKPIYVDFAAHEIFQVIETLEHQGCHGIVFLLSWHFGCASIEQHVSHERCAQIVAARISEVNASNAESGSDPKKARAGKDSAFGCGKEIIDLQLDRGDRALASKVAVQRRADRRIGQGGRDASVSDCKAVGQLRAQGALDGHAVAMDASELYSE